MIRIFAALSVLVATSLFAATSDMSAILDRLKSPASVCVMGDPCSKNLGKIVQAVSAGARPGDQVYSGACAACHDSGAAGAPKYGDSQAWSARVEKGMDTMVSNVINGYNAMPARGLCGDCSDEEIADAVAYMVDSL
ncbi:c-type cytochrome [Litorivicinus sp.]|nr:c-type cytochrome [Litorivicinus sp.]MDC1239478.1 c-type cytochrome [Litorivicinus sp.]